MLPCSLGTMRFTYPGTYKFIVFDKMSKLRQKLNEFGYFKITLIADKEINLCLAPMSLCVKFGTPE